TSPSSFSPHGVKKRFLPEKPAQEKKSPPLKPQREARRRRIRIRRATSYLQVLPFLLPLLLLSPLLSPSADTARQRPTTVKIDYCARFRMVTGRKQPQLVVSPRSGRSAYRSVGRLVCTTRTGQYDSKMPTLLVTGTRTAR
ncbi:hypothetical protein BHE74_00037893, partial [Ensete ventricosum]